MNQKRWEQVNLMGFSPSRTTFPYCQWGTSGVWVNEMTLIKTTFLIVQEQSNLTPEIRAPQDTFIGVRTVYCESIIIFLCTYGIACVVMQVLYCTVLYVQTFPRDPNSKTTRRLNSTRCTCCLLEWLTGPVLPGLPAPSPGASFAVPHTCSSAVHTHTHTHTHTQDEHNIC